MIMLVFSCSNKYEDDTKEIFELLKTLNNKKREGFFVVKSDSLEILNGGLPPRLFQSYTDKDIDSRFDKDIVIIEFNRDTSLNQIFIKETNHSNTPLRWIS